MITTKERLARALTTQAYRDIFRSQLELEQSVENDWATNLPLVDAILRELMEPSEGMKAAARRGERPGIPPTPPEHYWCKILQHILDEPQQEDDVA